VDRRTSLKWMLAVAASGSTFELTAAEPFARDVPEAQAGYGTDPDLMKTWTPGGPWPLTLGALARLTTTALCDLIIPADDTSPAASKVGVVDFIDEWVSAPYPQQRADRAVVVPGLEWLDTESRERFSAPFHALTDEKKQAIANDICFLPKALPRYATGAKFFARFRDLTATGFYTSPVGMKDIGYVGNTPLADFAGPPVEVLREIGLA
jgi:hypothetical protein